MYSKKKRKKNYNIIDYYYCVQHNHLVSLVAGCWTQHGREVRRDWCVVRSSLPVPVWWEKWVSFPTPWTAPPQGVCSRSKKKRRKTSPPTANWTMNVVIDRCRRRRHHRRPCRRGRRRGRSDAILMNSRCRDRVRRAGPIGPAKGLRPLVPRWDDDNWPGRLSVASRSWVVSLVGSVARVLSFRHRRHNATQTHRQWVWVARAWSIVDWEPPPSDH